MDPQSDAAATLPPVAALVDGTGLGAKVGQTISILAVGDDGWPRLSLLSVGEGAHHVRSRRPAGVVTRALDQVGLVSGETPRWDGTVMRQRP
jgi:hypothetical protein